MPLSSPFAYIITYDLKQPPDKYLPLFDELRSSYKWWHFMAGTWLVLRNDALVELGPRLRGLVFQPDRLLIMPAKGPAEGWLPKEAWDWIQENVPREW